LLRGCFREETCREPADDRDATWSWSRKIAEWVMGESCVCRSIEGWVGVLENWSFLGRVISLIAFFRTFRFYCFPT
jgi:hypothetical protein